MPRLLRLIAGACAVVLCLAWTGEALANGNGDCKKPKRKAKRAKGMVVLCIAGCDGPAPEVVWRVPPHYIRNGR